MANWKNRIIGYGVESPELLKANPKNWRKHPPHQAAALTGVLSDVGVVQNVIVNKTTGRLVDGHLRVELALKTHQNAIPVTYVELSEAEELEILATLDPVSVLATADKEKLEGVLGEVSSADEAVKKLLNDLALKSGIRVNGEILEDEAPEPPAEPKTVKGDLYELGRHRLLCGDSANSDDVAKLMDGRMAVVFATDPPYGIDYSNSATNSSSLKGIWDDIKFDELRDCKLQDFLQSVFSAWLPFLEKNAAWYLWHAHLTQGFFAAAAAAADVILHRQIIWVKPQLILGMGMYHWQHEPCFMGWRRGYRPNWYGDRKQTTIWQIGYEGMRNKGENKNHPTQKPVEIFARPIQFHSQNGEVCAEPFAGSGSQLMAAEQLGRCCCAMEIEPKYCDVIVSRWVKFTRGKVRRNGEEIEWAAPV